MYVKILLKRSLIRRAQGCGFALFWYRQAEMLLAHQEGLLTLLPRVSLLSDK
jgi:hypothetical protein